MNYSIMAHGAAKYGLIAMKVGAFIGGAFVIYGFGVMRGQRRVYYEIDRSLDVIKAGIELVIDEKGWKEALNAEMKKTCARSQ
jgi:hypothetical protein